MVRERGTVRLALQVSQGHEGMKPSDTEVGWSQGRGRLAGLGSFCITAPHNGPDIAQRRCRRELNPCFRFVFRLRFYLLFSFLLSFALPILN